MNLTPENNSISFGDERKERIVKAVANYTLAYFKLKLGSSFRKRIVLVDKDNKSDEIVSIGAVVCTVLYWNTLKYCY